MTKQTIRNRYTNAVIYECDADALREAVEEAIRQRANLRHSDLRYSDLRYSNLSGSDLRDSDLRYSDLRYSNLSDSNLSGSNLSGSDLSGSDLSGSNLRYSDLRYSNLSDSNLSDSNLSGSDLRYSNPSGSNLSGQIPVVDNLDSLILQEIEKDRSSFCMSAWHCGTTRCQAGWAIALAGVAASKLEKKIGPCAAAALIYNASTGRVPNFYASDDDAIRDMREHSGPHK